MTRGISAARTAGGGQVAAIPGRVSYCDCAKPICRHIAAVVRTRTAEAFANGGDDFVGLSGYPITAIAGYACSATGRGAAAVKHTTPENGADGMRPSIFRNFLMNDGLANRYLQRNNIDPTAGLRFRF
jgi:hypothetical protein